MNIADSLLISYFRASLRGLEQIPAQGGVLFVGNHSLWGIDSLVLRALVRRDCKRTLRFLAERNLWKIPGFGRMLDRAGAVPGSRETAIELLKQGEWVCVYPGGIDDSWKVSKTERYRLQWGHRDGFAKVALQANVPIVPVAGMGIDEVYTVLGREPFVGRALFGSPKYDFPISLGWMGTPIPRRAAMTFQFLAPIHANEEALSDTEQALLEVKEVARRTSEVLSRRLETYRNDRG